MGAAGPPTLTWAMFTRGAACIRSKALPCRNLVLPTYSCTQSVFTAVFQPRANFSTEPSFAEQRKAARAKRRQKPGKVAATVPADQLHTPADTATFNLESRRLLQRVEKGLADMCELNEGMSVLRHPVASSSRLGATTRAFTRSL